MVLNQLAVEAQADLVRHAECVASVFSLLRFLLLRDKVQHIHTHVLLLQYLAHTCGEKCGQTAPTSTATTANRQSGRWSSDTRRLHQEGGEGNVT